MSHVVIKPIAFKTHIPHHAKHILARDRARAQKHLAGLHPCGPAAYKARNLRARHHHESGGQQPVPATQPEAPAPVPPAGDPEAAANSIDVTDAGVTYTMPVGVGNARTTYTLLIDTGSSNTWIGADKEYTPGPNSLDTRNQVNVTYGSGSFTGTEYIDQVFLGGNLVIDKQSIGVASQAKGFNGVDGILGIGPVDLTTGTVKSTPNVPTITDNLFASKIIPTESIAISFTPTTGANGIANGEMTFGATDRSKFTGEISYVPITKQSPAKNYWGIDQDLSYGDTRLLQGRAGIVDTGTTLLLIATDAFKAYQEATGAVLDSATGLLTVTKSQFQNMQSMFFRIGSDTFEFTPDAQIWPQAFNSTLGGEAGKIYLITADLGNDSGSGLDFINGFAFLQRFYSVYDTTNSRVGLANTPSTTATTN